jgi:spore coat protein U-like protein
MNKIKKLAAAFTAGAALVASGGVIAGASPQTGTITVNATVEDSCTVGSPTLDAGAFDPTTGAQKDFSATLPVTCTAGTAATIALDEGGGTGATTASRVMTNGTSDLHYTIYSNPGRSTNWGNDTGNDTVDITGSGTNSTNQTLYARIFSGQQTATIGNYTDSVTVTVTF